MRSRGLAALSRGADSRPPRASAFGASVRVRFAGFGLGRPARPERHARDVRVATIRAAGARRGFTARDERARHYGETARARPPPRDAAPSGRARRGRGRARGPARAERGGRPFLYRAPSGDAVPATPDAAARGRAPHRRRLREPLGLALALALSVLSRSGRRPEPPPGPRDWREGVGRRLARHSGRRSDASRDAPADARLSMILTQVHLRKPCYDFYFLEVLKFVSLSARDATGEPAGCRAPSASLTKPLNR